MPRFRPEYCPHPECPSNRGRAEFRCRRRGTYPGTSPTRRVQRFHCNACGRSFSRTAFQPRYRLQKPRATLPVLRLLEAGISQRAVARCLGLDRKTVAHRLSLQPR